MKRKILVFSFILFVSFFMTGVTISIGKENDVSCDILIKNGKVFDGSLNQAFNADIAIKGDTILKVAESIDAKANKIIDAEGLYITPGFTDLHTHACQVI